MNARLEQSVSNYRNLKALLAAVYSHQKSTGTLFNYGSKLFGIDDLDPDDKAYATSTARAQGWITDREVDGQRWLSITGVGVLILESLR